MGDLDSSLCCAETPILSVYVHYVMTVDLAHYIHDCMVDAYISVRGEKPPGGFYPDDTTVSDLREHYQDDLDRMSKFLRDSMFAWMARTETTNTPFFINQHLLSSGNLDFIKKHKDYLRSFYGSGWEPRKFEESVYGAVLQSEQDWLDMVGGGYLKTGEIMGLDLISPTPLWILWSEAFGRFSAKDRPECWISQKMRYHGASHTVEQVVSLEHKKLADHHRREVSERAARSAIREAAVAWAHRYGAVRLLYEGGTSEIANDSSISPSLLDVKKPMTDRDIELFDAISRHISLKQKGTPSPSKTSHQSTWPIDKIHTLSDTVERDNDI